MVRWEPGGVFKTMCQIDITFYPFDEQVGVIASYTCSVRNITWISDQSVHVAKWMPALEQVTMVTVRHLVKCPKIRQRYQ